MHKTISLSLVIMAFHIIFLSQICVGQTDTMLHAGQSDTILRAGQTDTTFNVVQTDTTSIQPDPKT